MLDTINGHLKGIGECAAIFGEGKNRYSAHIHLWNKTFNDSGKLARWFHQCGATDVAVEHTLYCDTNGYRNGQNEESGGRYWTVTFNLNGSLDQTPRPAGM